MDASKRAAAEAAFRTRLAKLGVTLLEPYVNTKHPHQARCAAGHECRPRPDSLRAGQGPCRQCSRERDRSSDPKCLAAEAAFRARLAELGAELLEPRWLGSGTPHLVRCAAGHESKPRPENVTSGRQGPCRTCAGHD